MVTMAIESFRLRRLWCYSAPKTAQLRSLVLFLCLDSQVTWTYRIAPNVVNRLVTVRWMRMSFDRRNRRLSYGIGTAELRAQTTAPSDAHCTPSIARQLVAVTYMISYKTWSVAVVHFYLFF